MNPEDMAAARDVGRFLGALVSAAPFWFVWMVATRKEPDAHIRRRPTLATVLLLLWLCTTLAGWLL